MKRPLLLSCIVSLLALSSCHKEESTNKTTQELPKSDHDEEAIRQKIEAEVEKGIKKIRHETHRAVRQIRETPFKIEAEKPTPDNDYTDD